MSAMRNINGAMNEGKRSALGVAIRLLWLM